MRQVGILLTQEARKLRKETGDPRYRARVEDEVSSLKQHVIISFTRPFCTSPSPLYVYTGIELEQTFFSRNQ